MIERDTEIKKWGNSAGIVIPKEDLKKEKLRVGQKVRIVIRPVKSLKVKDIFGTFKKIKKPTKEIMKEIDKDLDSKFLGE